MYQRHFISPSKTLETLRKQFILISCDSHVAEVGGHSQMWMALAADLPNDFKCGAEGGVGVLVIIVDKSFEALACSFEPRTCLGEKVMR